MPPRNKVIAVSAGKGAASFILAVHTKAEGRGKKKKGRRGGEGVQKEKTRLTDHPTSVFHIHSDDLEGIIRTSALQKREGGRRKKRRLSGLEG